MSQFRCIVVDDDLFIREQIADLVNDYFSDAILVASCADGNSGIEAIRKNEPHVVFLDIQMPGMSGFDMLKQLPYHKFEIIFITSFDQYAITAIRFSALDYLLKPLKPAEFREAVNRFREKWQEHMSLEARVENLKHNMEERSSATQRLVVQTKRSTEFILVNDIIVCNSSSNYTEFVLTQNRRFLASKTLVRFEELLQPAGFIRVHRSHLVNPKYISKLLSDGTIVLANGQRTEVSRRKLAEVRKALDDFSNGPRPLP